MLRLNQDNGRPFAMIAIRLRYAIVASMLLAGCAGGDISVGRDFSILSNNNVVLTPTLESQYAGYAERGLQDITKNLQKWDSMGNGGSVQQKDGYVSISSDGMGEVFLQSPDIREIGRYKMTAEVLARDVQRAGRENFHRGKFQAVNLRDATEVDHPDHDFSGSSGDWMMRSVDAVVDGKRSDAVRFRIGLQQASGEVWVRNIRIWKEN